MPFDYTIIIESTWPPTGQPHPPFGTTAIDVLLACPLRSCFDYSSGYEHRIGVAARIGTALHKTLQSLGENPIQESNLEMISAETRRRFNIELGSQKKQAADHPREIHLLWDQVRVDRSLEAVIAEAIRTRDQHLSHPSIPFNSALPSGQFTNPLNANNLNQTPIELPAFEIPVQSKDGLIRGRIDHAEHIPTGTRLIDYKSAYRDDLPERYIHQVQIYAYLWFETTGEWPVEGQVFYPLKGTFYQVPLDQEICRQVFAESVALINQIKNYKNPGSMAKPGDNCKVCDYRPWCQPFWQWQSSQKILIKAKENAVAGFEGKINSIQLIDHYWRLIIEWKGIKIRLVVPQERFPHLEYAQTNQVVRFIDAPLKGALSQPSVQVYDTTEIFLII